MFLNRFPLQLPKLLQSLRRVVSSQSPENTADFQTSLHAALSTLFSEKALLALCEAPVPTSSESTTDNDDETKQHQPTTLFTAHLLHVLSTSGLLSETEQSSLSTLISSNSADKYELDRLGTSAIDDGQSLEVSIARVFFFDFLSLIGCMTDV